MAVFPPRRRYLNITQIDSIKGKSMGNSFRPSNQFTELTDDHRRPVENFKYSLQRIEIIAE